MTCLSQFKAAFGQGATYSLSVTWKDSSGNPVDLSGYSAEMRVAPFRGGDLVLNPSTANGQITLGPSPGAIEIVVPSSDTSTVSGGIYVYQLDLTSPSGEVTRLLEGQLTVDGKV